MPLYSASCHGLMHRHESQTSHRWYTGSTEKGVLFPLSRNNSQLFKGLSLGLKSFIFFESASLSLQSCVFDRKFPVYFLRFPETGEKLLHHLCVISLSRSRGRKNFRSIFESLEKVCRISDEKNSLKEKRDLKQDSGSECGVGSGPVSWHSDPAHSTHPSFSLFTRNR